MDEFFDTGIGILTAIIGVAIIAVLVSKNSTTAQVVRSFASAFGTILGVVVSPIASGAAQQAANPSANPLSTALSTQ